jgi:predicted GNAT family acetyltransferase
MWTIKAARVAEFLVRAGPLLSRDEARHNLIFGICDTLVQEPDLYPEFHLWYVDREGQPVAAALLTPPHNLVLAEPSDEDALRCLAVAIHEEGIRPPGALGGVPEIESLVRMWGGLTGAATRRRMGQGVYRLTSIRPVTGVRGEARPATPADRDLVLAWVIAFQDEALPFDLDRSGTERDVDVRLQRRDGWLTLWEDGEPVSMAGSGARTPNGARVGPVYTPPRFRRRGYGSAVTAAVSAHLLERHRFCFLHTDLANPTSNRIYQDIGYEHVCDFADHAFDYPS